MDNKEKIIEDPLDISRCFHLKQMGLGQKGSHWWTPMTFHTWCYSIYEDSSINKSSFALIPSVDQLYMFICEILGEEPRHLYKYGDDPRTGNPFGMIPESED